MSWGYVVCSVCRREASQSGGGRDGKQPKRWFHKEDASDICAGGEVVYADPETEPTPMQNYYPKENKS